MARHRVRVAKLEQRAAERQFLPILRRDGETEKPRGSIT
jgi:hypothetical protein